MKEKTPRQFRLTESFRVFLGMLTILLSVLIGYFDSFSGSDFTFSLFYLLSPGIAAWKLSKNFTILITILNIFIWQWVDISSNRVAETLPENTWNFVTRLILLTIFSLLIFSLRKALEREKELSSRDSLTNVFNSRSFRKQLDDELSRAVRYSHPLTLAFIDVDNFKKMNDLYGHRTGDKVLRELARTLTRSIRKNDMVGRLGGDEFSVLLIETGLVEARSVITSLQSTVNDLIKLNNWPISISIGVITCEETYCDSDKLIHLADQLMYSVKEDTKDSVNFATLVNVDSEIVYWEEKNHV